MMIMTHLKKYTMHIKSIVFTIFVMLIPIKSLAVEISPDSTLITQNSNVSIRNMINYKFIDKKSVIGGISFNYFKFDSDNSKMLFGMLNNINYEAGVFGVSPYVGYSFKDNQIIGMRVKYSRYSVDLDKINFNLGESAVSIGDIKFKQNMYSVGIFYRSYIGLDKEHRFGFFSEINSSAHSGDSYFIMGEKGKADTYKTRITSFEVGMSPGVAVFIHPNISFELSFNVVGFDYIKYDQSLNDNPKGKLEKSGANFRINPFNMNIGLTLCI